MPPAKNAQHAGLTAERWREFTFPQRILMIANELHRAGKRPVAEDSARRGAATERALALVDLTIEVERRSSALRELLRYRDCLASALILLPEAPSDRELLRTLLRFHPEAAKQIPFVAS